MSASKLLKVVIDDAVRSGFIRSISPVVPRDWKPRNGRDVLGSLAGCCLMAGMVLIMRLVLAR